MRTTSVQSESKLTAKGTIANTVLDTLDASPRENASGYERCRHARSNRDIGTAEANNGGNRDGTGKNSSEHCECPHDIIRYARHKTERVQMIEAESEN